MRTFRAAYNSPDAPKRRLYTLSASQTVAGPNTLYTLSKLNRSRKRATKSTDPIGVAFMIRMQWRRLLLLNLPWIGYRYAPKADSVIPTGRNGVATVWREGDFRNGFRVSVEAMNLLACGRVPKPYGFVQ